MSVKPVENQSIPQIKPSKCENYLRLTLFVIGIISITIGVLALYKVGPFSQLSKSASYSFIGGGALLFMLSSCCPTVRRKHIPTDDINDYSFIAYRPQNLAQRTSFYKKDEWMTTDDRALRCLRAEELGRIKSNEELAITVSSFFVRGRGVKRHEYPELNLKIDYWVNYKHKNESVIIFYNGITSDVMSGDIPKIYGMLKAADPKKLSEMGLDKDYSSLVS